MKSWLAGVCEQESKQQTTERLHANQIRALVGRQISARARLRNRQRKSEQLTDAHFRRADNHRLSARKQLYRSASRVTINKTEQAEI